MSDRLLSEGADRKKGPVVEQTMGESVFNLSDWIDGRGQATRSVRVYGALELFGEREALGHELEAARAAKDADAVADLKARIDELTVRMQDDVMDFKLRGVTRSKQQEIQDAVEELETEDAETIAMFLLSHYIVEPAGVTAEQLLGLAEWDFVQANNLVVAMNQLNQSVPNIGASRPF